MKYLIPALIVVIAVLLFCLWYKNRESDNLKTDKNQEIKNHISGLANEVKELRESLDSVTKDTVFNSKVQTITNNFTKIYEKINSSDSLDPIIDGLLAGHRQTKVERDY